MTSSVAERAVIRRALSGAIRLDAKAPSRTFSVWKNVVLCPGWKARFRTSQLLESARTLHRLHVFDHTQFSVEKSFTTRTTGC